MSLFSRILFFLNIKLWPQTLMNTGFEPQNNASYFANFGLSDRLF